MRAWLVGVVVVLASRAAGAYPQFQFTTGTTRCTVCHYAPAGGGLINGYGRDESADTISKGGNGTFLYGWIKPPAWLKLGGDLRGASIANAQGSDDGPEYASFPMQGDLYTRFEIGKKLSVNLIAGVRGTVRPSEPSLISRFVSREHWVQWRPGRLGYYVRAGRFFAPFGLRLVDHTSYTRRFTGFHTLEETYNISVGWLHNEWEAHVTAFRPDFFRPVGQRGSGVAVYVERRPNDKTAIAIQGRASLADNDQRYAVGAVFKRGFLHDNKLLLMSELDLMRQEIDGVTEGQTQIVSHVSGNWWLKRAWLAGLAWERYDENLRVKDVARDAVTATMQWFPRAHWELIALLRARAIGAGDGGDPAYLAMFQLHYYL